MQLSCVSIKHYAKCLTSYILVDVILHPGSKQHDWNPGFCLQILHPFYFWDFFVTFLKKHSILVFCLFFFKCFVVLCLLIVFLSRVRGPYFNGVLCFCSVTLVLTKNLQSQLFANVSIKKYIPKVKEESNQHHQLMRHNPRSRLAVVEAEPGLYWPSRLERTGLLMLLGDMSGSPNTSGMF